MHSYYDWVAARRQQGLAAKSGQAFHKKVFEQLKAHPQTRVYGEADIPHVYAYIKGLFPPVSVPLSRIFIFKNANTAFFKKVGLPAVGGMYSKVAGAVVICYNKDFDD